MAKSRTRSSKSAPKGISPTTLFILGIVCFALSKLFANKLDALDHAFAVVGLLLFGFSFWKYFKNRKR